MKLLEIDEKKNYLKILVETPDDLIHLALLINKEDIVYGWSERQKKIQRAENEEKVGRVRVFIGIEVEKISFSKFGESLRITGKIVKGPENLNIQGLYHTINVHRGDSLEIEKRKEWSIKIIEHIIQRSRSASKKIFIISLDFEEAALGLLTDQGLNIIEEIESGLHSKRKGYEQNKETLIEKYLEKIIEELKKHIKDDYIIILYGPGFLKEELAKKIRVEIRKTIQMKLITGSLGGTEGLWESIHNEELLNELSGFATIDDMRTIKKLIELSQEGKTAIGLEEISKAAELKSIDTLIISGSILHNENVFTQVLELAKKVISSGGRIKIIPPESEAGKNLELIGGISAILRYKIPDLGSELSRNI
ncbi:MAG: hypothetical protein QW128_05390 [Thermoprotei archaeon]